MVLFFLLPDLIQIFQQIHTYDTVLRLLISYPGSCIIIYVIK